MAMSMQHVQYVLLCALLVATGGKFQPVSNFTLSFRHLILCGFSNSCVSTLFPSRQPQLFLLAVECVACCTHTEGTKV